MTLQDFWINSNLLTEEMFGLSAWAIIIVFAGAGLIIFCLWYFIFRHINTRINKKVDTVVDIIFGHGLFHLAIRKIPSLFRRSKPTKGDNEKPLV